MRNLILLTVVAALALPSCTSILTPELQVKLDKASAKYEATTGITATETAGLLTSWWHDYQQAKGINALLKTDVIRATQASPITSAKDVITVRPVTFFMPPAQPKAQPKTRERPSPRDPPQMIASH